MFHPVLMLKIPLDRQPDTLPEHRLRFPTDLRLDLVRGNGVPPVMSFPIFHISNQIFGYKLLPWIIIGKHLL